MEENPIEKGKTFWNDAYKTTKGFKINKEEFTLLDEMKPIFDEFCEKCPSKIIDFGCGEGSLLMLISNNYKIKELIGIEDGKEIVRVANEFINLNDFKNIKVLDNGIETLKLQPTNSFDGIIISNVLDVIPLTNSNSIMKEVSRVIKETGYFIFKTNPSMDHDSLITRGFTNFEENLYSLNGVLRFRLLTNEEWIKYIESYGFKLINQALVPYQAKEVFDNLYLFQKTVK